MKIIEFKNVEKKYGDNEILKNINFIIEKNEAIGLMGESGSGKSTIAKLLCGIEKVSKGNIFYKECDLENLRNKKRGTFNEIQMVFQNAHGAVNPNFKIKDILLEPLEINYKKNLDEKMKNKKIIEKLESVNLKNSILDKYPKEISGGELQRVCLARALMLKPEIIIFDEVLSALDPIIQKQILKLLGNIKEEKKLTYIFISHDYNSTYYLCDKIIKINNGQFEKIL